MSIRFKFRSSAIFDSVDLEGRPSISVRELRLKIIRNKNLNMCQDFDLVFSDSVTGEEYNDENFQIPSGACIIVKRVPAGTLPSANTTRAVMINDFAKKASDYFNQASVKVDDVDDFGTDMCLPIEKPLYASDHESNKGNCCDFDAGLPGSRFDCQNPGSSGLSQAIYKGSNHSVGEQNLVGEATTEWKFKKEPADLPVEFKCPLCNTFFKEAVLIPCCQHSFCKKCISFVLLEKKICPICFSIKCKVEDLLPNLSLRQAIEHFFGSQVLGTGSPNDLCQLVPDGESGIQAREISCAVTVIQREPDSPHSPSATGHGSNQVLADSFYEPHRRSKPHKMHMFDGKRSQYAHLNPHGGADDVPITVFDGGNQPFNLCKTRVHDEGAETKFWATGRHKQGGRTCYICGSPEHLMRNCTASNSLAMPQTGHHMLMGGMPGYPSPYWNNTMYSPISPFTHIYGNPETMPFRAPIIPTPTFSASPYMPFMPSGVPLNGLRKEGMAPLSGTKTGHLLNQKEFMESQQPNNRRNVSDQNLDKFRGKQCYSKYDNNAKEWVEYRHAKDREASTSNSDDTFGQISARKHQHVDRKRERSPHSYSVGRDRALLHTERSISSLEDKCEHHHRDTRKPYERRGHGSDSSWGRHHVPKEESSRDSRHNNRLDNKDRGNDLHNGRRTNVDGLYEDSRSEYHHHKRKRAN
ncbi:unnamed protein product [Cuscuta campestris]|uniref:RING-type domain-containing protein n=1 Tax=Cuscuta campestris TaxID=132261 RepID=A0A484M7A8_9ASTE|nr:unnamed protein product [Cuscuta campestris]